MTRDEAIKALPTIIAFSEGETIQYRGKRSAEWRDVDNLEFFFTGCHYRVKPKTSAEEIQDALCTFLSANYPDVFKFAEVRNPSMITITIGTY